MGEAGAHLGGTNAADALPVVAPAWSVESAGAGALCHEMTLANSRAPIGAAWYKYLRCRAVAEAEYGLERQAAAYLDLYNSIKSSASVIND